MACLHVSKLPRCPCTLAPRAPRTLDKNVNGFSGSFGLPSRACVTDSQSLSSVSCTPCCVLWLWLIKGHSNVLAHTAGEFSLLLQAVPLKERTVTCRTYCEMAARSSNVQWGHRYLSVYSCVYNRLSSSPVAPVYQAIAATVSGNCACSIVTTYATVHAPIRNCT